MADRKQRQRPGHTHLHVNACADPTNLEEIKKNGLLKEYSSNNLEASRKGVFAGGCEF